MQILKVQAGTNRVQTLPYNSELNNNSKPKTSTMSHTNFILFLVLTCASTLCPTTVAYHCLKIEAMALLNVKLAFGNPPSLVTWNSSNLDCCSWTGVWCDSQNRMTDVVIANNDIMGPIAPAISHLSSLQNFMIIFSNLTSSVSTTIPESIGELANLTSFRLYNNYRLTGPVPDALCKLEKLKTLVLSGNGLTGPVPDCTGKDMETMDLSGNKIRVDMSKMKFPAGLKKLDLSRNRIYGSIPKQVAQMKSLKSFNVSYNELCGPVPDGDVMKQFGRTSYDHNKCLCGKPLQPCH